MNKIHKILILSSAFILNLAQAQTSSNVVQFPIEELPSEVVTPVVDSPYAVESALIQFNKSNSIQLQMSSQLDEAFYSGLLFGASYNHHINDKVFIGLSGDFKMKGNSKNADSLGLANNEQLDFTRAPQMTYRLSVITGYRFIYGKISFTKEEIRRISIFTQADVGMADYSGKTYPYVLATINDQLFLNPKDSIILSLGLGYRQQPNVLSQDLSSYLSEPDKSSYDAIWNISTEIKLSYSRFF